MGTASERWRTDYRNRSGEVTGNTVKRAHYERKWSHAGVGLAPYKFTTVTHRTTLVLARLPKDEPPMLTPRRRMPTRPPKLDGGAGTESPCA